MSGHAKIGLDNSVFQGRLRQAPLYAARTSRTVTPAPLQATPSAQIFANALHQSDPKPSTTQSKPQSQKRQPSRLSGALHNLWTLRLQRISVQGVLFGMACVVFVVGLAVSLQTMRTNGAAAAQIQALSKQAGQ